MRTAVVIPVGAERLSNLEACLTSIQNLSPVGPELVVLVGDGSQATKDCEIALDRHRGAMPIEVVELPKHEPGMCQPRNAGVRRVEVLDEYFPGPEPFSHVWFLDSDIILADYAYEAFQSMENFGTFEGVMLGPYDFMPPGETEPMPQYRQDVRWASFERNDQVVYREDLSAGLACFGGNLMWPLEEFKRVGGFWDELHHGRCEDGELGLRAVACGVEIAFVSSARGWHIHHGGEPEPSAEWVAWATRVNAIDVPKIDARHPWLHGEQVFVVEEDGKRFDMTCACGWSGNTAEIWNHLSYCVEHP